MRKGIWTHRFISRRICSVNILMNRFCWTISIEIYCESVSHVRRNYALIQKFALGPSLQKQSYSPVQCLNFDKHNSFDIEMNDSFEMVPQFCTITLKYCIFYALISSFIFSMLSGHVQWIILAKMKRHHFQSFSSEKRKMIKNFYVKNSFCQRSIHRGN